VRFLNTVIAVIVALAVILFAVSNRQEVEITLWPLPLQIDTGVYAVVLMAVLVGFIGGMVAAWMAAGGVRRERRRLRSEVRDLEQSLGRSKMMVDGS
jgi:putative membrane protein